MRLCKKNQNASLLVLCFLWLATMVIGGTVAYLFTPASTVINTFSVPSGGSTIEEKLEENVKKEVVIQNTGDIDVYIRAKVIFTWKNMDGEVHPTAVIHPEDEIKGDYEIKWNDTKWQQIDGFYYYNGVIEANGKTDYLFTDCTSIKSGPEEGYTLHVEILTQTIQDTPDTAVSEAWGMSYSGSAWTKVNQSN